MDILVDSSVWINYFRGETSSKELNKLIDENLIVINDIILTELIPFLKIKKQLRVINLLKEIKKIPININWNELIEYQTQCLTKGANGIGIPDLIIAQNAIQSHCKIYSHDKHFKLLEKSINLKLY